MEMSGEDYKALMEEKFKNVHETIDRNYKEQKEERKADTLMVLDKIDNVLAVVSGIEEAHQKLNSQVEVLESETSWWRNLQKYIQKQPKTFFVTVLIIWYLASLTPVKEFLFSWLPVKPKVETVSK